MPFEATPRQEKVQFQKARLLPDMLKDAVALPCVAAIRAIDRPAKGGGTSARANRKEDRR